MNTERITAETRKPRWPKWLAALARAMRTEIAYHRLVRDLSALRPELLADLGIGRHDIHRCARLAATGREPAWAEGDGPATTIGSPDWSRAFLLRLGSH